MYNHSGIWKNITMIIFFILLLIIILILFVDFKINILFKVNGTKSYIEIKFWKFRFVRKGKFNLKKKRSGNLKYGKANNFNKQMDGDASNNIKLIKRISLILKAAQVKKLNIIQEIGLLEPISTALAIPVISTVTVIWAGHFKMNPENFYYKVIPSYNNLKFDLCFEADISLKIITVISSIIKGKIAQIKLKTRR